jgi:hypothetical protein
LPLVSLLLVVLEENLSGFIADLFHPCPHRPRPLV